MTPCGVYIYPVEIVKNKLFKQFTLFWDLFLENIKRSSSGLYFVFNVLSNSFEIMMQTIDLNYDYANWCF